MAKDIRLVIFDLDGTIAVLDVDWEGLKGELEADLESRYGIKANLTDFDAGLDEACRKIGKDGIKRMYRVVERYETEHMDNMKPVEVTGKLIRSLAGRGVMMAVLSSNTRIAVREALSRLGMTGMFSAVVAKEDVAVHKPDPEGILKILGRLKVDRGNALLIGDTWRDSEAGRRAGVETLLVTELESDSYCRSMLDG